MFKIHFITWNSASLTVDSSGGFSAGAQVFGVKLRKATRHSPPDVTADVEKPKRVCRPFIIIIYTKAVNALYGVVCSSIVKTADQ